MDKLEKIRLSQIDDFSNHPFKVNNDDSLKELADSIKENGLLNPITVRPKPNGRYELISGHRRKTAMESIGLEEANAIIKELTDDEATIEMVDSNMYRDKILPSEKAFAYKMKLDAMKHQGKKTKTSDTECPKLTTEKIGSKNGDSSTTVKNYVRLTYLIPELLKIVDETYLKEKKLPYTMGLKPAVELSYLNKDEQILIHRMIVYENKTPNHAQAIQIRKMSKNKKLTFDNIENLLCEKKGNQQEQIQYNKDKIYNALPFELRNRDKRYQEDYIVKAIECYKKMEQKKKEDEEWGF